MALISRKETENLAKTIANAAIPEEPIEGQVSAIDLINLFEVCDNSKEISLGDLSSLGEKRTDFYAVRGVAQSYIDEETGEIFEPDEVHIDESGNATVQKPVVSLKNLTDYTNQYLAGNISRKDWEEKAAKMAGYIRSQEALLTAIAEEKKNLDERKHSIEKANRHLRELLQNAMNVAGITRFETGSVKVTTRTTKRVEVIQEDKLREVRPDLFVEKTTYRPDKTAIKAALSDDEEGILAPYAGIAESKSLTIK